MTHADPRASASRRATHPGCEACGAALDASGAPLLEVPVPAAASAALGLGPAPLAVSRLLCPACLARGLGHHPVTLAELVDLAPPSVKQAIHERLIHEFEI